MRISLNLTAYPDEPDLGAYLEEIGRAADEAGLDTVWLADHLIQAQPGHDPDEPMLEVFATLGFLAHCTTSVRLGAMVSPASVRAPALLVKSATTLDVLSGGRAWLGVGAGYQEQEARAMGLDLPDSVAVRFARLEDTLRIATRMIDGDAAPFAGDQHTLQRPTNRPAPIGRLPIMLGGAGERRTLRLVARYAQACNVFDIPDGGATIRHKLAVLDRHCAALDRDPAQIDRSVSMFWPDDMTPADLARRCRDLAALGVTHAVLLRRRPWRPEQARSLADVAADMAEAA